MQLNLHYFWVPRDSILYSTYISDWTHLSLQLFADVSVRLSMQHRLIQKLRSFLDNTQGSTAVEYATLLALVAATLLPVVQLLGNKIKTVNQNVAEAFQDGTSSELSMPGISQVTEGATPLQGPTESSSQISLTPVIEDASSQ